jgi:hypothetical protein
MKEKLFVLPIIWGSIWKNGSKELVKGPMGRREDSSFEDEE